MENNKGMGMVHFARGELKETASMIERALTNNPDFPRSVPILSAALAQLGQEDKARKALEDFKNRYQCDFGFRSVMFNFPFQDSAVLDIFANGIAKAGLLAPIIDYYKLLSANMLSEDDIRELMFNRNIEVDKYIDGGKRWRIDRAEDGKSTAICIELDHTDRGRSWIEDNMLCEQWEIQNSGYKACKSVFLNPEGTPEMKNEYVAVSLTDFYIFSTVD